MCLLGHSKRVRLIPIKKIQFAMTITYIFFKHYNITAFNALLLEGRQKNYIIIVPPYDMNFWSVGLRKNCIKSKKKFSLQHLLVWVNASETDIVLHKFRLDIWIGTIYIEKIILASSDIIAPITLYYQSSRALRVLYAWPFLRLAPNLRQSFVIVI